MQSVRGSFAAVSSGMGKVVRSSSCPTGRGTFLLSFGFVFFLLVCVFPIGKKDEMKRRCWGGRDD